MSGDAIKSGFQSCESRLAGVVPHWSPNCAHATSRSIAVSLESRRLPALLSKKLSQCDPMNLGPLQARNSSLDKA